MLHEFITANRADIIARCTEKSLSRLVIARSNVPIDHGVPMFLDQLIDELRQDTPTRNKAINQTAIQHGHDLLTKGFTVSQVVHDYGDVCQSITELAVEHNAPISTDDFRRLNRCLDDAIAGAVTEYGRERDRAIDLHADTQDQRLVDITQSLRTAINAATVALGVVKTGSVGIAGSTGSVLDMSLNAAHTLVDNLLDEFSAKRRATEPTIVK